MLIIFCRRWKILSDRKIFLQKFLHLQTNLKILFLKEAISLRRFVLLFPYQVFFQNSQAKNAAPERFWNQAAKIGKTEKQNGVLSGDIYSVFVWSIWLQGALFLMPFCVDCHNSRGVRLSNLRKLYQSCCRQIINNASISI